MDYILAKGQTDMVTGGFFNLMIKLKAVRHILVALMSTRQQETSID